jgi:glutamate 5-kinase
MINSKYTIVVRVEISTLLSPDGKVSRKKLDRLAMAITNLFNSGKNVIIVSSGAIVLGSEKLCLPRLPLTQLDMQATAAVGQAELMRQYQQYFAEYNQMVAQVLLTSDLISYPQRVVNARNTFQTLLNMGIIPVVNENDPVSTADIDIDDNYPLARIVAQVAMADFIAIKMEINGKYMIVPRGNNSGIVVNNETELQDKIESMCHVMDIENKAGEPLFPSTIGDIMF